MPSQAAAHLQVYETFDALGFSGNSRSVDDVTKNLVSPSTGDHVHLRWSSHNNQHH